MALEFLFAPYHTSPNDECDAVRIEMSAPIYQQILFIQSLFAMSQNNEAFLTIGDIFAVLRKRWKFAIFSTFMMAVFGGLFVYFVLRPTYFSQGALYVRLGKNTLTVDPTASSSSTVSSLENRHQEVVSVKELLKSREVGERVC